MICFRDRTYCAAQCANKECPARLTDEAREAAAKWWNGADAPIALADMSDACGAYVKC